MYRDEITVDNLTNILWETYAKFLVRKHIKGEAGTQAERNWSILHPRNKSNNNHKDEKHNVG